MPTSREWASIILLGAGLAAILFVPAARAKVPGVLKALFARQLVIGFSALLVLIATLLFAAFRLGFWTSDLLTDSIFLTFGFAFPMAGRAVSAKSGPAIARDVLIRSLGLGTLLLFYLNLEPFPLWGELLFQLFVTFVALLMFVARRNTEQQSVANFLSGVLILLVLGAIAWSTVQVIVHFGQLDWETIGLDFALSLWLPALLLPFFYVLAFVSYAELIIKVRLGPGDSNLPFLAQVGFLLGLRLSVAQASEFHRRYRGPRDVHTRRQALRAVRDFRADVRRRDEEELGRRESLVANAGRSGVDADGAQLDRREFYNTKSALDWIAITQMGRYEGNGNRYWNDITDEIVDVNRYELPSDHGLTVQVTSGGQQWRCWRLLPSGWYLGMGGENDHRWNYYYSGGTPPSTWPDDSSVEWPSDLSEELPPDWAKDDDPID
jgi:hypothetical protein